MPRLSSPGALPGELGARKGLREAVQLDFEFDGELTTDSSWGQNQKIQDQFLYTIGHLNHDRSVGRLDRLVLTNVVTTPQGVSVSDVRKAVGTRPVAIAAGKWQHLALVKTPAELRLYVNGIPVAAVKVFIKKEMPGRKVAETGLL